MLLDAIHDNYIDEAGSMNIFVIKDGIVYTPPLDEGTILAGVTRESVIQLCYDMNIPVKEEALAIDDIIEGIKNGTTTECFGSGTAAVIAPIGEFIYEGKNYTINDSKVGKVTQLMYNTLVNIQKGHIKDRHGWIVPIE